MLGQITARLEGRKGLEGPTRLWFETSQHNISMVLSMFPSASVEDHRGREDIVSEFEKTEAQTIEESKPRFRMEPRDYQLDNFNKFKNQKQWAIFSEQGTGKTKVAIDIICHRYLSKSLTGVIILSNPKGVHSQWITEQLPKHIWEGVDAQAIVWEKKAIKWKPDNRLQIISGNIDMVRSELGFKTLYDFSIVHRKKLLILVDESDSIKTISTERSRKLREIALVTEQRAIMTGTPIAKDLTDEWAQFYFLNPDIVGNKYLTSFRAQYCIMGGFEGRAVVGHRNLERFKELTAPYIFRATKADLNLPPKVYDEVVFDMEDEQKKMIRSIRDSFFASLGDDGELSVKNGATALMRIQQISNGFIQNDEKKIITLPKNPRLLALKELRKDIQGKVIIWCRFRQDVKSIAEAFPDAVTIYGENDSEERKASKEGFINGNAPELIATPGAAGKGVDGLQTVCSDAIYYSNSYNAIDRWQSEDRIDRIGMRGSSTFFDLIARGSVDRPILRNLRDKKDISSLALDDIVKIMDAI